MEHEQEALSPLHHCNFVSQCPCTCFWKEICFPQALCFQLGAAPQVNLNCEWTEGVATADEEQVKIPNAYNASWEAGSRHCDVCSGQWGLQIGRILSYIWEQHMRTGEERRQNLTRTLLCLTSQFISLPWGGGSHSSSYLPGIHPGTTNCKPFKLNSDKEELLLACPKLLLFIYFVVLCDKLDTVPDAGNKVESQRFVLMQR